MKKKHKARGEARIFQVSLSFPHLGDRQLQLNHVLGLGHRRLEGRVQEQDAVQVLPASHCIVVHKKNLVHCWKVLTPDSTAGFSCDGNRGQKMVSEERRAQPVSRSPRESVDNPEVAPRRCRGTTRGLRDSPCAADAWRMAPDVPSITLMLPRLVTAKIALRAGW
ncbi:hypothetical protein EYF80_048342 [Liparis tanakae]|uniref:Uncharacterized protein n=1 Tax=Liparis tanakae TaxID=230148 RepID=A0A4Z2FL33_9TELE|nr:hypothetical protein EYF80_048342 [Liparis tanakae]